MEAAVEMAAVNDEEQCALRYSLPPCPGSSSDMQAAATELLNVCNDIIHGTSLF